MVCGRPTATNVRVPEFEAFVLAPIMPFEPELASGVQANWSSGTPPGAPDSA